MSEQGVKVHLACDGLNRTGQVAPASHDRNRETGKCLPVEKEGAGVYNLGGRTNGKGCQKWEDGKRRRDDVHTEDRFQEQSCGNKKVEQLIREADKLPDETLLQLICLARSLAFRKAE